MIEFSTKISTKGQMVVPKTIRDQLKITPNTAVKIRFDKNNSKFEVYMVPDPIKGLLGIIANKGYPTVEQRKNDMLEIEKITGKYE